MKAKTSHRGSMLFRVALAIAVGVLVLLSLTPYCSWLDQTGVPLNVQQELMRHADITTTMNIYGAAMNDSKRQANSNVVSMALKRA